MKKVLVAPLDWGLGHATRSVPVIRELLKMECEVIIGGAGESLQLLKHEFPQLSTITLPAYDPKYPSDAKMILKMLRQLPHFLRVIRSEHRVVSGFVKSNGIAAIISDNRYGCWSRLVPSVLITHQSNVLMPRRFGWLSPLVRSLVNSALKKFDECWIPDYPDGRFSGSLTCFGKGAEGVTTRCIGTLSRFTPARDAEKRFDVTAICSGPEPQRSLLENLLERQLEASKLRYFLVRGVPSHRPGVADHSANYLTAEPLQELIERSELVISRSGYSSIMDLATLGKKAIFIPTPGQTEQEYLAAELKRRLIAFSMSQDQFDLQHALEESRVYSGFQATESSDEHLKSALLEFLSIVDSKQEGHRYKV